MPNLDLLNEFWVRAERKRFHASYATRVRESRPFSLDDELTEIVGEIAFGSRSLNPSIMRRYVKSARPVFDKMWIECDYARGFAHRLTPGAETTGVPDSARLFGDVSRIGWIIDALPGDRGYSAARVGHTHMVNERHDEIGPALYPIIHLLQRAQDLDYTQAFNHMTARIDRINPSVVAAMRDFNQQPRLRRAYWGYGDDATLDGMHAVMIEPTFAMTLERGLPDDGALTPDEKLYGDAFAVMQHSIVEQASEIRFISVALALLCALPVKFTPYKPSGRAMMRGTTRPYLSSSIVTIEMPRSRRRIKEIEDRLLRAEEAQRRRAHEVIGHYRTADAPPRSEALRLDEGAPPRWESYIDRDGKARWRQWIAPHMRGDASLGFVQHDAYDVVHGQGSLLSRPTR